MKRIYMESLSYHGPEGFQQSGHRERAQGSVLTSSFCHSASDIKYNVEINCACL